MKKKIIFQVLFLLLLQPSLRAAVNGLVSIDLVNECEKPVAYTIADGPTSSSSTLGGGNSTHLTLSPGATISIQRGIGAVVKVTTITEEMDGQTIYLCRTAAPESGSSATGALVNFSLANDCSSEIAYCIVDGGLSSSSTIGPGNSTNLTLSAGTRIYLKEDGNCSALILVVSESNSHENISICKPH